MIKYTRFEAIFSEIFQYEITLSRRAQSIDGDIVRDISIPDGVAITWCRIPAHGWKINSF
uniref:Uncharacterized protein n=1 Tax=Arundo donax TaxID=35708 RepID=A0A0A9D249_ARUDO